LNPRTLSVSYGLEYYSPGNGDKNHVNDTNKMTPLLEIKGLKTELYTRQGPIFPVDDVDLEIYPQETVGLVGESGCGKTVTALSILRLINPVMGRVVSGTVLFQGKNLLNLPEEEMRSIRGNRISMIFQEPMSSLNPVLPVGEQIAEVFRLHQKKTPKEAWEGAVEMMHQVKIPESKKRAREYPHQMSGGMRQRIMIAMAMACKPDILIADEPTTALDVTIQAQILSLMEELKEEQKMAILLITHNLGIIAQTASRVAVMYTGRIVESAPVNRLFQTPLHPYSRGLLHSLPPPHLTGFKKELSTISGVVPELYDLPIGCKFQARCPLVFEPCRKKEPVLEEKQEGHWVRCYAV